MAQDPQDFLRRWSRRKQDAATQAAETKPAPAGEAPALPSPDSLTFESDFKAFMQAKVAEGVKRAALKKLFSDPRFNVMDGLDTYIDDYSKGETLTAEMVAALEHSKSTLLWPKEEKEEAKDPAGERPGERQEESVAKKDDGDPRQDA